MCTSAYGRMKSELLRIANDQRGSSVVQYFTMEGMQINPDTLTSHVTGVLHTMVGRQEVASLKRTFRFEWTYTGIELRLVGFGAVSPAASPGWGRAGRSSSAPADATGRMIAALGPTCVAAAGAMLAMRAEDRGVQLLGAAAIAAVLLVSAAPAHADQSLTVADNASVECVASQTDATRISLVGDAFASVSKMRLNTRSTTSRLWTPTNPGRYLCLVTRRLSAQAPVVLWHVEEGLRLQVCLPDRSRRSAADLPEQSWRCRKSRQRGRAGGGR